MLLFNLLILFMVIILSYIFKLSEVKKYDTQLIFILLIFTILIMYKTLNYIYNKKENNKSLKMIVEKFTTATNLNDFISDTLSNKEKIISLQNKIKQYEDVYDVGNVLNNDLENKIKYSENALSKLSDQYIIDLENANPSGNNVQISIDASDEGIITETPIIQPIQNINTDSIKNIILQFAENLNRSYNV
jgi:hypothetical protein